MEYNIIDLDRLEESANTLSSINDKISENADSIQSIINQIQANWQNDKGTDCESAITELTNCVNKIKNAINPTVSQYVRTINTLATETRTNQAKSIS